MPYWIRIRPWVGAMIMAAPLFGGAAVSAQAPASSAPAGSRTAESGGDLVADEAEIARFIQQLGDERFFVREQAQASLAKLGYDPPFGARPLKRVLQREILNELSKQILAGKVNKDSVIFVDMKNDVELEFINLDHVEVVN